MKNVSTISSYMSLHDLFMHELPGAMWHNLPQDTKENVRHVDDFDCSAYYVFDGEIVITCDAINGDVISGPVHIVKLFCDTLDYVKEDTSNEG